MAPQQSSGTQEPRKRAKGENLKNSSTLNKSKKSTSVNKLSFYEKHEVPRKVFHSLAGGATLIFYILGFQTSDFIIPFIIFALGFIVQDFFRLRNPALNDWLIDKFKIFMRPSERHLYNGVIFYQLGLLFLFVVFPKDICIMGTLFLSWGDTFASFVGREFGKYTPKISDRKSVAGCIGSFLVGSLSCYLLYGYLVPTFKVDLPGQLLWTPQTSRLSLHSYAFASGVICSVSEAFDVFNIDDNLTIPVLGGSLLYTVVYFFRV